MIVKHEIKMNVTYQSIDRTATGQRTFKYRETKIWNALDEELKSTANLKLFNLN